MLRTKQPYLVNPPLAMNPFETLRIPAHRIVAKTDKRGRFVKVASLTKTRKHKAKKIGKKTAVKLFKKASRIKAAAAKRIVRAVKRHVKRAAKKSVKRVVRHSKKKSHKITARQQRAMQRGRLSPSARFSYDALRKEAGLRNPLMLVNSKRRKSMKKKYRRNPIVKMLSGSEVKGVGQLALDGALIVAGVTIGKLSVDALSSRFAIMQKPMVRMGTSLAIASLIYVAGSRTKKVPARVVNMVALGILLPAVTDAIDMIKGSLTKTAVATVAYGGQDMSVYLPKNGVGAYVPQQGMGDAYAHTY